MPIKKRSSVIKRPIATSCFYCDSAKEPSYKEYEDLAHFMTDRAKILGKVRSALCSKHQRRLAVEIKRARQLALLPFKIRI